MKADDEIFGEAVELPVSERGRYLAQICAGDAARQARIEALLSAHDAALDFLERPLIGPGAFAAVESPGTAIGRYTLLEKIGEGGCGTVYSAEQHAPVRRRVALKIIKLGMDTRQVIARFQSERQALAMMDHPDIARVLDADTTPEGRPYFVMDLVEGVSIHRYCDEHRLDLAARLALFVRVCLALQHAHQKGIIHRDVKPSNILVAERDGAPAPKVIDFGIAKATQGRLTDQTLLTGVDQFIGTPAYMSPEQADSRDGDIDTRSDVYALGVLLYELLSGRLPFEPESLRRGGVDHARRVICTVEPPRPSVRYANLAAADRETIAGARHTEPAALMAQLRDDLDWIAMRCLEKDRARRYGSAQELADDVRRHLAQEPIFARPPTATYRTRRFVARHRVAVASAAAIALSLIAGTAISVRQAVRASRAERVAKAERDTANAASRIATQAKADAQRRQEQAEDLLTFMLGNFRAELKNTRIDVLDAVDNKALEYFASLDQRDLTDTVLSRQAKALYQIGETRIDEARYQDAKVALTAAYERAAALAARNPGNADMLFERAQAEFWLGAVARYSGDAKSTRLWLTRYRDSALALVAIDGNAFRARREVVSGYHNLAVLDMDADDLDAARHGFVSELSAVEALLKLKPNEDSLRSTQADIQSWFGTIAERGNRFGESLEYFGKCAEDFGALTNAEPHVMYWRFRLAGTFAYSGEILAVIGRLPEAEVAYQRADALSDALLAQDPKNRQWQILALNSRLKHLAVEIALRERPSGLKELAGIRATLDTFLRDEPSSAPAKALLANAWRLEARLRYATPAGAQGAIERAIALDADVARDEHTSDATMADFAQACLLAGRIASARGEDAPAKRYWTQTLNIVTPRLRHSVSWRLLDPQAQALVLLGREGEARTAMLELRDAGYHPLDPLAASLLAAADFPSRINSK